jgi:CheY-like chemotaxis protein
MVESPHARERLNVAFGSEPSEVDPGPLLGSLPDQPCRLRLVVVDDYPDVADSFAMLLSLWGHEVHTFHGGRDALEAATRLRPDAVLTDILLPDINGYELARWLGELPDLSGMTLVAVTGLGDKASLQSCREAGFDHHLLKPVEPGRLQEVLGMVTARKQADR